MAKEGFGVGLSLDGPQDLHDRYRVTKSRNPTHEQAMRGYNLLRRYRIPIDILCVVHSHNVQYPIQVYEFFKQIGAQYLTFLPLVELQPVAEFGVSRRSVEPDDWGTFLCNIFDEWIRQDIGQVKIQIFEEAASTAVETGSGTTGRVMASIRRPSPSSSSRSRGRSIAAQPAVPAPGAHGLRAKPAPRKEGGEPGSPSFLSRVSCHPPRAKPLRAVRGLGDHWWWRSC